MYIDNGMVFKICGRFEMIVLLNKNCFFNLYMNKMVILNFILF